MSSEYFTTTPEMKAPVEVDVAAAGGNYVSFHVPVHGFVGLGWSYPCDIWSVGCILVELCTVSLALWILFRQFYPVLFVSVGLV